MQGPMFCGTFVAPTIEAYVFSKTFASLTIATHLFYDTFASPTIKPMYLTTLSRLRGGMSKPASQPARIGVLTGLKNSAFL